MPKRTNMSVQTFATARNAQAEAVSNYIFTRLLERLPGQNHPINIEPQRLFDSPICRDRWDHSFPISHEGKVYDIWAQTTCYKGHEDVRTESNKTYEVRETIVESLTLKALAPAFTRAIHLTYGDSSYTYSWFKPMKDSSFDKSVYLHLDDLDIFDAIASSIGAVKSQAEIFKSLDSEISRQSPLGRLLIDTIVELEKWVTAGLPGQPLFGLQAELIRSAIPSEERIHYLLADANGSNFKAQIVEYLLNPNTIHSDEVKAVGQRIIQRKPFLATAKAHVNSWPEFEDSIYYQEVAARSLGDEISRLWNFPNQAARESIRRILLRCHTDDTVDYIQDLGIAGVTEHNLYRMIHNEEQTQSVARILMERLDAGLDAEALRRLIRIRGKGILRQQIYFESKNGTSQTSSFDGVCYALESQGFIVSTPSSIGYDMHGYHGDLINKPQSVRPYTNFRIVSTDKAQHLCILKGKFFSRREFDRRSKEESFVGLTLRHEWTGSSFKDSQRLPLIMFVDMDEDFKPPRHSVAKLLACGWNVSFSAEDVTAQIRRLA